MLRLLASLLIVLCACDGAMVHECWRIRAERQDALTRIVENGSISGYKSSTEFRHCLTRGNPDAPVGERACFDSFEAAVVTAKAYGMKICGLNQEN